MLLGDLLGEWFVVGEPTSTGRSGRPCNSLETGQLAAKSAIASTTISAPGAVFR